MQNLIKRKQENKLAHAFLFCGDDSDGKLDIALNFAKFILCENPNTDSHCRTCCNCILLEAGNHPDFFLIQPEENSKQIKIDQIRALSDDLSKTSSQGGYKVVIIAPADLMNIAASNALLKTLEEPEDDTLLILVSSRIYSLPATIRSRCQKVVFNSKEIVNKYQAEYDEIFADLMKLRSGEVHALALAKEYMDYDFKVFFAVLIKVVCDLIKSHYANLEKLFLFLDKIQNLNKVITDGISLNKQLMLEDLFLGFREC